MLNKYPEIWLRESVKLVDLQTSSIFCLPPTHPMLFFSGPVSPGYKRPTVQRRDAGLRHSNQLLLINVHTQEKKKLTCTHMQICLDLENLVWSAMVTASQLIWNRETVSMQNFCCQLFSIIHKMLMS